MNSVIQCLANTEPLAKFFLYDCYVNHINDRNPLGTRGKLVVAFAELLTDLYTGDASYVAPWDVKNIIARRAI
jgi:ubiquitin C-terminal hydrolase